MIGGYHLDTDTQKQVIILAQSCSVMGISLCHFLL